MAEQITLEDDDPRMYQRGMSVAHSCDEDGIPDVGLSIGLGGGAMLYLGEKPGKPAWCLCIYQKDGPTIEIAECIDGGIGSDVIEAMHIINASILGAGRFGQGAMTRYVTRAGSEIDVMPSRSFIAHWDWFEEKTCCIDARPIDVCLDEGRLLVTVSCDCHGEAVVIAQREGLDDGA